MDTQVNSRTIEYAKHMTRMKMGIQPAHKIFYYYSILYTAECSVRAFEFYEYLLAHDNVDSIQLVGAVQEAIGHAGALAFYFWNNGSSRQPKEIKDYIKQRSENLKNEFDLDDDSALKNRSIRNTFEHFDEKIDVALLNTLAGVFYPMPIIQSHKTIEEEQVGKYFKLLDIEEKCLVLLNQKFFFENIQKEVNKIYQIAKEKVAHG
ncbi:hypothetical protein [Sulfurimonas sp. HSL3-7]|uniref:hypothetical protein n=1 Tax=Sulfonitrofixus jiaomeiensis TaxID=3131938 RepID=UPI0031F996C1